LHPNATAGAGETSRYILLADVDHARLTGRVEMRKMSA
jgi:hypothetical protein